jgi:tetratricopeptide (TPR) repeat protein
MRRYLSVLVLAALCTGCFAMQRTPDATVLRSLQTIAVIPLEPPVPTHVSTPGGGVGFNPGAYGLVLLPVVVVGFIVIGTLEANRVAAIPEGALTLEKEPDVERGMLTGDLARAAATILQRFGARTAASVVDGYLRLPVTDRAMSPGAVRSEMGTRLRRWYNEDVANVDYGNIGPEGIDAILEVGISEYQFRDDAPILQVHVRLVNPATKAVLGRATHRSTPIRRIYWFKKPPRTSAPPADLAMAKGWELMVECLRDLGLLTLKTEGVRDQLVQAMMSAPSATGSDGMPAPGTESLGAAGQETQDAIALYRQGKVVEAEAAFDKRLAERPGDVALKVWKALALLEQARAMKDAGEPGDRYNPLMQQAYTILHPLGQTQAANPDWRFAMAKTFWLNDRPTWAARNANTALDLRTNFAEPHLLLGDIAYDSLLWPGAAARTEYNKALAVPDLAAALQAEALYKLGQVAADLDKKPDVAREYWERAVVADPACRYGIMAQQRLKPAPAQ